MHLVHQLVFKFALNANGCLKMVTGKLNEELQLFTV